MLAPFANYPEKSRGRRFAERESTSSAFRNCFQRDCDRIIHSSAFRRLQYKTQVFVVHGGDYYCTRLTHTLEVAQIARTLARALSLNSDLAEAIALAHDLGHPPFGHGGETALQGAMEAVNAGSFDHNAQAFRLVSQLECHYADFDGLNLSWETLEGIAKHNGPMRRPLPFGLENEWERLQLNRYGSAEAQVAAISDDIAYNNRDIQDGLRAGLFTDSDISAFALFARAFHVVDARWPALDAPRRRHEALRFVFSQMVSDVLEFSRARLADGQFLSPDAIRAAPQPVVDFSPAMKESVDKIRRFLFKNMYRAPVVMSERARADTIIKGLFSRYFECPEDMPKEWQAAAGGAGIDRQKTARAVADYISGMTDRFAIQEADRFALAVSEP